MGEAMTDRVAISGNYADFKLVKTRSVAAVIIEIPIEQAEAFLKAFGVPQPGSEKPVALALLRAEPKQEKARKPFDQMSRAQQAGILCADERFQKWLRLATEEDAADYVRTKCGVASRSGIDGNPHAETRFDRLVSHFRMATGQQAEMRS